MLVIADAVMLEAAHHALLAVTTATREELGGEEYEAEINFAHFAEFGEAAGKQPDGVFPGFDGGRCLLESDQAVGTWFRLRLRRQQGERWLMRR